MNLYEFTVTLPNGATEHTYEPIAASDESQARKIFQQLRSGLLPTKVEKVA